VTLVRADGSRQEGVNLVVRRGLVEALAPGAAIPADAKLLEGDSLVVYPGLVDGDGAAEVAWPEVRDVPDEDDVRAWSPPRSRQGFLPHRRVADHLTSTGADLAERRAEGVVAALVHPDGGLAPGQPAVLVHRNGDMPWELVESSGPGLTLAFQSASGVYPSQLFGVIAFLRQAFLDAERYETMRAAQRGGPGGFVPPGWDPDYEALRSAARGDVPVYFRADSDEDIRRVLGLSDELGFRVVLVGGQEAWKVADELVRRRVPVLASLAFPELMEWDPEADTVPDTLEPGAAREKERMEALWSNAGRLEQAGVTFALTSGAGDADLLEGLRKVVEHGLSPAAALRAVTLTPATLLGIPDVARIEPGRPATFVVTTGDLLEEDTRVAYTFVEGHLEEAEEPGADGGEAPDGDLSGSWTGEVVAGGQEVTFELELTQEDDGSLSGSMSAAEMPTSSVSGRLSGREVTLRIQAEGLPEPIELDGTLSEDGTTITGSGSSPFGELTFRATKSPGAGWAAILGGGR
jgi:hypothetical protein